MAALLEEMKDVRGSGSFEHCETEFRYSRCIRQGSVEASVFVEKSGQIRVVEGRVEVEGKGVEERVFEQDM